MDNKVQYFEKIETPLHQDFVHNQGHCVLCRHALELKHTQQAEEHTIKEEAYCPECQTKARAKIFTVN